MSKHHSEDYKISAVKYYLKRNNTLQETCEIFNCSYQSLQRWVNKFKNKGHLKRKKTVKVPYNIV